VRPVVTTAEMQAADAAAPVPVDVLVQRAGWAVATAAAELLGAPYGRRVTVLAGKGNNGADGRAAGAVLARRGARVTVVEAGTTLVLPGSDLVVDAAYGTGFRGSFEPPDAQGAPVLAVDIPSGVRGDTGAVAGDSLRAVLTVTMAALKPGLLLGEGPDRAGTVVVADIGLPVGEPAAHLVEDADRAWLPAPTRTTHKWKAAVFVVAGSPGLRGAPLLCTRGALRSGAGMVRLGSPGVTAGEQPPGEAVAIGLPASGWEDVVLGELGRFRALVVGPGLGRSDEARAGVRAVVAGSSVPTLVDADGLNVLGPAEEVAAAVRGRPPGAGDVVLTPHDGEFARLAGRPPGEDRVADVRDLAARTGAVVLLKGATTIVAHPSGQVLFAAAGSPRLATAGTGDVLSGVIGAFLARGLDGLHAAALGAHVHGRAAGLGPPVGLVAGDLPDLLPAAISGWRRIDVESPPGGRGD
jgi:NAD(P)H-hydrate epimerase